MKIAQPPPPTNGVELENGKCAPKTKPTSVEEETTAAAIEEDASKAAPEAVAPKVVAASSAAAKPKPQGDCVVCGHLAKNFCSSCKHVFYCTRYRFVICGGELP